MLQGFSPCKPFITMLSPVGGSSKSWTPCAQKSWRVTTFGRNSASHCFCFCWLRGLYFTQCKFSLRIIQGKINESSDRLGSRELGESVDHTYLRPFEDNNYHTDLHSPLSEQQLSHTLALTTYHECPFSKTTTSHILAAWWEQHWLVNWSKDITMGLSWMEM